MPEETKTTTIGGIRYDQKLLGYHDAIAVGVIVAGPALRALDELFTHADVLGKVFAKLQAKDKDKKKGLDDLDWQEILELKDAHLPMVIARAVESLGIDGVRAVAAALTPVTTVYLPSPVPGAVGLFPVPLSNDPEAHWKGKFPLFMAWLTWGVWAQGFFDVSLLSDKISAAGKAVLSSRPASTGSPGA
jgi:hypothetical protein